MHNTYHKSKTFFLSSLIFILLLVSSGCFSSKEEAIGNTTATPSPSTTAQIEQTPTPTSEAPSTTASATETATDLSEEEVNTFKSNGTDFFTAAYNKDYTTVTNLMTDAFRDSFEQLRNNDSKSDTYYGADLVLNLSDFTSSSAPTSVDAPEYSYGSSDYRVTLHLNDDKIAIVSYSTADGTPRVSEFSIMSSSKKDGGVAGGGQ